MFPYCVLVLIPLVFNFIKFKGLDEKKQKGLVLIIYFSILFLLMSLRALSVGNDTLNYLVKFRIVQKTNWNKIWNLSTEPAYNYLSKIITLFTKNYQVYLTIISAIILIPVALLYVRESEIPMLTIALFMIQSNFSMLFSGLRQSVAISVGLIAFVFVRKKKLILFLLTVILAFYFHNSAIILLLMYPVYHLRINNNRLILVAPVLLFVFVFNRQIFTFFKPYVSDYYTVEIKPTGAYMMLVVFILFAVMAFLFPEEDQVDSDTNGLRNLLLLTVIIQVFASLNPLAMRMGYYFSIFIPILIPRIMVKSDRWRQFATLATVVMTVFFLLYFFYNTPSHNALHLYPYHFFWGNPK